MSRSSSPRNERKNKEPEEPPQEFYQSHSLDLSSPLRGSGVVSRHFPFRKWAAKQTQLTERSSPGSGKRSWIYCHSLNKHCCREILCLFQTPCFFFVYVQFEHIYWQKRIQISKSSLTSFILYIQKIWFWWCWDLASGCNGLVFILNPLKWESKKSGGDLGSIFCGAVCSASEWPDAAGLAGTWPDGPGTPQCSLGGNYHKVFFKKTRWGWGPTPPHHLQQNPIQWHT